MLLGFPKNQLKTSMMKIGSTQTLIGKSVSQCFPSQMFSNSFAKAVQTFSTRKNKAARILLAKLCKWNFYQESVRGM